MRSLFNSMARDSTAKVLKEWGVDFTTQPDGSLLIEGREAFAELKSPRQTADPSQPQRRVSLTMLARDLSQKLFGSEDSLLMMQMAEYCERRDLHKLLGAPPGFMGSDEGGWLTNELRKNPTRLLFLDEVEKASRGVMQAIDDGVANGVLTDNKGQQVSLERVVVVKFSETVSPKTQARREKERMTLMVRAVKEATVLKQDLRPLKRFQLRQPGTAPA
jgi:hypothetical protein